MSMVSTGLGAYETRRAMRRTYTIDEAAALLGLSRNAAYVAAREDRLPVRIIKIGKRMLVSRAALDRFLDGDAA